LFRPKERYNLGLIGFGYWGPILLRNFSSHPQIKVKQVCDRNPHKLQNVSDICGDCEICHNASAVLENPEIDVVAIATQAATHFALAEQALRRDKHVFVEKPLTLDVEQARRLIQLAQERNLILMVDHPHLFQTDHHIVKQIIQGGEIGKVLHYHSTRADFGLFQTDTNVVWHTLYHDIYIILDLFPTYTPFRVNASGFSHIVPGVQDTAVVSIEFRENLSADFVANWLFPQKERKIVIAGDRRLIYWDYTAREKVRLFHKSARLKEQTQRVEYDLKDTVQVRDCEAIESLRVEVSHLVDCLNRGETPLNNGDSALQVMQLLQRIDEALQNTGRGITV
jgi:predicted dehydrogenase